MSKNLIRHISHQIQLFGLKIYLFLGITCFADMVRSTDSFKYFARSQLTIEISKVFKGVSFTDSLRNYLTLKSVSLCQFLFFLDIEDIAQYIEHHFYSDKDWQFRYNIVAMIKFTVVKFFRQQLQEGCFIGL